MEYQHYYMMVQVALDQCVSYFVFVLNSFCNALFLFEDSVDLECAINSVWVDIEFALVLEVLLCGVESCFFDS